MPLFKSAPNLPVDEKARIEFHLQQIAECIGFDRFKLPVLSEETILYGSGQPENQSADQFMGFVGNHLGHDVSDVTIETVPLPPEKCGGGG